MPVCATLSMLLRNRHLWPSRSRRLDDGLSAHFVQEVDNDVVFLDAQPVEVFSHSTAQLVLALSPEFLAPCHRRRVQSNAAWFGQDPFADVVCKGGRCVEAVGPPVRVEDVALECRPLELFRNGQRSAWSLD